MGLNLLNNVDVSPLEDLLIRDGKIIPVPFSKLKDFSQESISVFCHKHALYQVPTTELIDFLKSEIGNLPSIEIGAGNGCIGRSLGIMMTDNKMQDLPHIKLLYSMQGQPTVKYGNDVEEIPAIDAVIRYKPKIVVACWVTHFFQEGMTAGNMYGIKEEELFDNGVEKYIHVGNESPTTGHTNKPILFKYPVKKYKFPWLLSRSMKKELNTIFIFNSGK